MAVENTLKRFYQVEGNVKGKIVHLTSVHPRFDSRIFLKECRTLASFGYSVDLVVADGRGNEVVDGVNIYDVGSYANRWQRIIKAPGQLLKKALMLEADVYHLHDPELIPLAAKLKRSGKKIIFDSHEDIRAQILSKSYLNKWNREIISYLYGLYENKSCTNFDAIVAATPLIFENFSRIHPCVVNINNFPIENELASKDLSSKNKRHHVCYIGGLSRNRGIKELVQAINLVEGDTRLLLAGHFCDPELKKEMACTSLTEKVDMLGFLDRKGVKELLEQSVAGLVTLRAEKNYVQSLPIKMFEYMSAGVPVIASNFTLWRSIIEAHDCGICVDPTSSEEIAQAITFFLHNPERAQQMGKNGQQVVADKFNWENEEQKLLKLYESLMGC